MLRFKRYFSSFGSGPKSFFQLPLCHSLVPHQSYSAKKALSVRRLTLFASLLLSAVYLTSCEKVIQVDLNDAEKKYVIEAVITDQPGSCKVILTQTKNFDENNTFAGVSGAQVTIADNNGTPQTLVETSPGVYEDPTFTAVSSHTYRLAVNVDGKAFSATSVMPGLVNFDSLYITERTFFDEKNKYATVKYNDPAGVQNAYRFIQYVNGVKEKTIFVRDDDSNDGLTIERTLLFFSDDDDEDEKKLKSGDNVRVEMLCISYPVYKYWYSLAQSATGENQSATPGNPVTNIQGGALGYFSAHTLQSKTIEVP